MFGPKYKHFCFFHKILELDKFEGADFKYANSFFLILVKQYPNKIFLVPNLRIFVFSQNFQHRQIRGC